MSVGAHSGSPNQPKIRAFGDRIRRFLSVAVELDGKRGDRERVVILGSGWAGFVLSRQLDKKKFQIVVVSPRTYFVFTPLLASTAVGTLEFRTTLEPVRPRTPGIEFFQGWADEVNFSEKILSVEDAAAESGQRMAYTGTFESTQSYPENSKPLRKGKVFNLAYDKLVIAVGCYNQTFGTPGVKENAYFLRDAGDARRIRERILQCFEIAALPTTSTTNRRQILNFAIIGGGPTGVEFAAELYDLCNEDLKKLYPSLIKYVDITIYDVAPKILPMFDHKLADYALNLFQRDGIKVKTEHHIQELQRGLPSSVDNKRGEESQGFTLSTREGGEVGVGICVWSTGLMMNPFVDSALGRSQRFPSDSVSLPASNLELSQRDWVTKRHPKTGGVLVDDCFRVKLVTQPPQSLSSSATPSTAEITLQDVFALGDVAVLETGRLPATAQVANQEAKWLGKRLNKGDFEGKKFEFRNLGVLTYLGNMKAIMQTEGNKEIKGITAWLVWRGAYLTQTISWRNKLLIPVYWAMSWIFGRDISRF